MFEKINAFSQTVKQPFTTYWKGISVLAVLLFALWVPIGFRASAVHDDDLFELGNATDPLVSGSADIAADPGPPCDWADLFDPTPSQPEIDVAVAACGGELGAFVADQLSVTSGVDDTSFAGQAPSNKNNFPISDWTWTSGNVPAKDDLSNVYIYGTNDASGNLILYVGLERIAANGDSHLDVEFNQQDIGLDEDPPCKDNGDPSPCSFTGEKTVGDILIVMDFEQGGALGSVEVFEWDGTEWISDEKLNAEGCTVDDFICAVNNGDSIVQNEWPSYNRHGGTITSLPANAFTEFGINVTGILGHTPCITSSMAKSRSSQDINSDLKDFSTPQPFDLCEINVDKTGPDFSKLGDTATYTYNVTNIGQIRLYKESITDDVLGDLTSYCGAFLDPGESCIFTVDHVITGLDPDPLQNTVTVIYDNKSTLDGNDITDEDDHTVDLVHPSVDVEKSGDSFSKTGDTINYVITITNTGDVPLVLDSINDPLLGSLTVPSECETLDVGETCTINASHVVTEAEGMDDSLTNHVEVSYSLPESFGLDNVIPDQDDFTTTLVHPDYTLTKDCPAKAVVGETVTYTFVITNTGDVGLVRISVTDTLLGTITADFPASLAPSDSATITKTRVVLISDPNPIENTVTAVYGLDPATGLPNTLERSDSCSTVVQRPVVKITGFGYENVPGEPIPEHGIVSGNVTYTVTVTNFQVADALSSGTLTVKIGGITVDSFSWTNELLAASGGSFSFTLTVEYNDLADGTVIRAELTSTYKATTLNSPTFEASGSPAVIEFTVQAD